MTMCKYQQDAEGSNSSPTSAPSHKHLLDKVDIAFLLPPPPGTTSVIVAVAAVNVGSSKQSNCYASIPAMTDVTIVFPPSLYITNNHNPIPKHVSNIAYALISVSSLARRSMARAALVATPFSLQTNHCRRREYPIYKIQVMTRGAGATELMMVTGRQASRSELFSPTTIKKFSTVRVVSSDEPMSYTMNTGGDTPQNSPRLYHDFGSEFSFKDMYLTVAFIQCIAAMS
jgi:hypothetical protein